MGARAHESCGETLPKNWQALIPPRQTTEPDAYSCSGETLPKSWQRAERRRQRTGTPHAIRQSLAGLERPKQAGTLLVHGSQTVSTDERKPDNCAHPATYTKIFGKSRTLCFWRPHAESSRRRTALEHSKTYSREPGGTSRPAVTLHTYAEPRSRELRRDLAKKLASPDPITPNDRT